MKPHLRVYAFEDPVEYLNYELKERQRKDGQFSIRKWAKQVGYANPSYLSEVLRRERKLTVELAAKLALSLGLEGKAYRYFELCVILQRAPSEREKQFYAQLLRAMRPVDLQSVNKVSLEAFSLISDWYHWAILEMTNLKDFSSDLKFIQERLGAEIGTKKIAGAIDRLVEAGLLKRDEDGRLRRANQQVNVLDPKMARMAAREYQKQMAQQALLSLADQKSEEIDFQGSTLAFNPENMAKAKAVMREAHKKLLELSEAESGKEVYQFNSQFFRLTKDLKSKKKK